SMRQRLRCVSRLNGPARVAQPEDVHLSLDAVGNVVELALSGLVPRPENSPAFQRWKCRSKEIQSRQRRQNASFVPPGLCSYSCPLPSDKSLGYFLSCPAGISEHPRMGTPKGVFHSSK